MNAFDVRIRRRMPPRSVSGASVPQFGSHLLLVLGTALGYGLSAWGGLTFQTGTSGIAIFWPASGFSAGLAIAIGRSGYGAIGIGTILATIAVNLYFGRNIWIAGGFGLLNAAETLLMARLLELVPEQAQASRRIMRVLAFFGAGIASTAASGFGAAILIDTVVSDGASPFFDLWRTWSLSDLVGIIVVAPLLVAIHELASTPELRKAHDWKADAAVLFPFLAVAYHTLGLRLDDGTWASITPGAALLPLLLWLSARSQPIVPALAILILAITMAWFAASGTGRYGDPRLPHEARVLAAQVALGTATIVAQVVMALYSDRRLAVARLKASEMRLAAIVDSAPGVIFSAEIKADGTLSFPFVSSTSSEMLGLRPEQLAAEPSKLLDRLEPRDRRALLETLRDANSKDAVLSLELPLQDGSSGAAWIEIRARPVRDDEHGTVWHGFIQDITMRRHLVEEMDHRTRNLLSVTQAIAEHTARHTPADEIADVLTERLAGLAASHQLLAAHHWEGADLELLARTQLSHLSDLFGHRIFIAGPDVSLLPTAAKIVGMALHELATNACKHGALANESGTVALSWALESGPDGSFRMCWREQGGHGLPESAQQGFGSKITIDMPAYQLKAKVDLEPRGDGLVWSLVAPATNVVRRVTRPTGDKSTVEEMQVRSNCSFNMLA